MTSMYFQTIYPRLRKHKYSINWQNTHGLAPKTVGEISVAMLQISTIRVSSKMKILIESQFIQILQLLFWWEEWQS